MTNNWECRYIVDFNKEKTYPCALLEILHCRVMNGFARSQFGGVD